MVGHVVFDIGQVLLVWDPELLYRRLVPNDAERRWLFERVLNCEWRDRSDFLMTVRENTRELAQLWPSQRERILAWDSEFEVMMPGPVDGAWELVADLQASGHRAYAIANFAADKCEQSLRRFPFLRSLDGMIVSSEVGCKKPDPAIYWAFLGRYGLDPRDCVFVDDDLANVAEAERVGMRGIVFEGVGKTRHRLAKLGLDTASHAAALSNPRELDRVTSA